MEYWERGGPRAGGPQNGSWADPSLWKRPVMTTTRPGGASASIWSKTRAGCCRAHPSNDVQEVSNYVAALNSAGRTAPQNFELIPGELPCLLTSVTPTESIPAAFP